MDTVREQVGELILPWWLGYLHLIAAMAGIGSYFTLILMSGERSIQIIEPSILVILVLFSVVYFIVIGIYESKRINEHMEKYEKPIVTARKMRKK